MPGSIRLPPGEVGEGHEHFCGCGGPAGLCLLSGPSAGAASISAAVEGRAPPEPGPTALRPRTRFVPWEPLPALLRCEREVGVSSLPTPSCASDQPDAVTEGRRRPEVRAVHRQPCLLGGTFIHSPILQMCVGPGAGSAALTQTNKVAALLEVTHSWDLETTHVLLITAALIC